MTTSTSMIACVLLVIVSAWPSGAAGQGDERPGAELGPEWVAIDPARLDELRGGFVTSTGMALSFGIERAVFVNGALVATTRVHIPDVARMTGEQAQQLARFNEGLIVQVGANNRVEPSSSFNGVVIQNSSDGQDLRALTTVNVGVDTLGAFQDMNTQAALHSAQIRAVGAP